MGRGEKTKKRPSRTYGTRGILPGLGGGAERKGKSGILWWQIKKETGKKCLIENRLLPYKPLGGKKGGRKRGGKGEWGGFEVQVGGGFFL